ncbi:MAG TPA: hypothetical protein VF691_09500, partial [Cytophagaceae bacterium]
MESTKIPTTKTLKTGTVYAFALLVTLSIFPASYAFCQDNLIKIIDGDTLTYLGTLKYGIAAGAS